MNDGIAKSDRLFVAGHRGMVGSAIVRRLRREGYTQLITRTHAELDLSEQSAVREFFSREQPECVVLAAAKVGGIMANETHPAEFIRENLAIQTNVIHESWGSGVKRLIFLGSSCIYPRECPQPMREEYLLTGPLEPTNEAYALAKIAGIEMCAAYNRQYGTRFACVMPTNLFGPGDSFDLAASHVVPALIRKAHEAKVAGRERFTAWGTGSARRELMVSDDLADAVVMLLSLDWDRLSAAFPGARLPLLNVGTGEDLTIREIAKLVCDVVGFKGSIEWDASKPDGTPRKLLDVSRIHELGWRSRTPLRQALEATYRSFTESLAPA